MVRQLSCSDASNNTGGASSNSKSGGKSMVPSDPRDANPGSMGQTEGAVETITKVTVPKMYRVMLLNDDFTPMEFVVSVLKKFFAKSDEEATRIMLDVHNKGMGTAGVYTLEIAEMKVMQVNQFSRMNEHPLKCTLEQE